ncbi:thymidine phosphorylase [Spirochaeta africana]|uniref:thymidine phosphorylase n=1 Tax=Spirochaeta africana (strain ATCC 700263 / DSM 8902 / Z-7692) TaxID=889378 RepID=H9UJ12_SPIAZ|nr:thymidine phosphorylase [Spirochaeta africana]AFG37505.1 pyrimidine-nucleoside phosphorylase [Spirochaeta africana DSM 8902]
MNILDIIRKKRNGEQLSPQEIAFFVQGYVDGSIPDYQISALLMAIFFRGMIPAEISVLTRQMIDSGRVISLPENPGPYVDKHSTGGVGDKVSLILAPIVAALGVHVPMMSGRALGHTGGTLDKLDSIPGYTTALSEADFVRVLGSCGFAMTGQSKDIVPADRLMYALRDVTATVESIPLITASILSKKFAEGADALVFDVKTGRGAFMATLEDAEQLAASLVRTAAELGKTAYAVLTDMSVPLGYAVGNFLEVEESVQCLQGNGPDDLMEVTHSLAACMLHAAGKADSLVQGRELSRQAVADGSALDCFYRNVELQGGDPNQLQKMLGSFRAPVSLPVTARSSGWVAGIDALEIGLAGIPLGVGRSKTTDQVRPDVGFMFDVTLGDRVDSGDRLCTVYAADQASAESAAARVLGAVELAPEQPAIRESLIVKEMLPK